MLKRLLYFLVFIPLTLFMGIMIIVSLIWWMITGKDLLWVVNSIKDWMGKLLKEKSIFCECKNKGSVTIVSTLPLIAKCNKCGGFIKE